jgi:hypothetical protein
MLKVGDRVKHVDYFAGPYKTLLGIGVIKTINGDKVEVEFPGKGYNTHFNDETVIEEVNGETIYPISDSEWDRLINEKSQE